MILQKKIFFMKQTNLSFYPDFDIIICYKTGRIKPKHDTCEYDFFFNL